MPARFINLDRQTPMFLPCDLREWIPDDHLVHFILDAVPRLPVARFHVNHRGTGSEQNPPAMTLGLLIYCYATGRFGSRTIEAATYSDVALHYLCTNTHPDHDSICASRPNNETAFGAAIVRVLQLAKELRLAKLGTVSVDGAKIQANASKHAAVSYQRAGELIGQLELEARQSKERAQQAEGQEGQEALVIPAEIKRRESRKAARQKARLCGSLGSKLQRTRAKKPNQASEAAKSGGRDVPKRA